MAVAPLVKNNTLEDKLESAIDWELALSLTDNNREFAEKMLDLLVKDLPEEIDSIKKAYANNKQIELAQRIHKLHGALCYCGAAKLKMAAATLEKAVTDKSEKEIPHLLLQLEKKAKYLVEEVHRLHKK